MYMHIYIYIYIYIYLNIRSSATWKRAVGLYRDDGLALIENANGPLLDRLRKKIIALFKDEELSITIETNLSVTDFLDVTLDLSRGKYYPYRKPNDKPLYINASSNHPPTILKQLPKMINRRISDLSCTQEEFEKAKSTYETALRNNGYDAALQYEGNSHPRRNRNRKRKILWFNPPYNQQVQTNIGKLFIRLVKKHFEFPRDHKLHKIFNTNTIKLSYCCTNNMANIIKQHNSRILSSSPTQQLRMCNCRVKSECPMDGKCLTKCIVYKAEVGANNGKRVYYGASEGEFKTRYNNHTKSFRSRRYCNESELSKYIWKLKDNNTNFILKWSIASFASPYKCGTRKCDLCLSEKVAIVRADPKFLLNKRTELVSKCRHRNKFLLHNMK